MGLIHVFLFLNVKDGPSRFRMASFYAVSGLLISEVCRASLCIAAVLAVVTAVAFV